jgi:plasmid stabilization system protein ParE
MSLPISLRPTARAEYASAVRWYEDQQPGLGAEFETAVEAVLTIAAGQPDRYPVVVRDIREAPVGRFPYCVYYRVRSARLVVVAVFHQSRDPGEWQSRP